MFEAIEKFSVIKTLQAIEASNVVLLMIDAQAEVSEQDAHIAGFVLETGRAVVVAITSGTAWTATSASASSGSSSASCAFSFARMHTISALKAGRQALAEVGQRRARGGFRQVVHAPADARIAGRRRTAAAAAQGHFPL